MTLTQKDLALAEKHMKTLGLSREDAIQLVLDDKAIDKGEKMTVSEMMKKIPELANLSNQRVTSLVTALYSKDHPENRVVERAMDKRKAVFFIPEDEENAEENEE